MPAKRGKASQGAKPARERHGKLNSMKRKIFINPERKLR
jgi:hypothetical protein